MPTLSLQELTLVVAVVASVAVIALLLLLFTLMRMRKLRREYAILRGDGESQDIFAIISQSLQRVDSIDHRLDGVVAAQQEQAAIGRYSIQKFAVVRYDAFGDMGGQLSFTAALLDEHGDGIVITSINGRTETRTYAKSIKALSSAQNLSDEEREAIATAVAGFGRDAKQPAVSPSR